MDPAAAVATDAAGFGIVSHALDEPALQALDAAIAGAAVPRSRAGARGLMSIDAIAALAREARLAGIASAVLGRPALPFRATLFDKSRAANWLVTWHQDRALPLRDRSAHPAWGPWSRKAGVWHANAPAAALEQVVALRVHLDDSTRHNGPLRVLPGTHRHGVLAEARIDALVAAVPPVCCEVGRGGVLWMKPLLLHASSKAADSAPRRVLHIEYAERLVLEDGLEIAVG